MIKNISEYSDEYLDSAIRFQQDPCFGYKRIVESKDCIACLAEKGDKYSIVFHVYGDETIDTSATVFFSVTLNDHNLYPIHGPRLHNFYQYVISSSLGIDEVLKTHYQDVLLNLS